MFPSPIPKLQVENGCSKEQFYACHHGKRRLFINAAYAIMRIKPAVYVTYRKKDMSLVDFVFQLFTAWGRRESTMSIPAA
jgi:hypothetical protein